MKLAIIPARGGSKRIPRKNIKTFFGKPMIAWSIEAALKTQLFDRVIVSTDDEEIAYVGECWGAEVPFMRKSELADDFTTTSEVMADATKWAIDQGHNLEAVCCIYATAPFIQVSDIIKGWNMIKDEDWNYVFAATDFAAPIFRSFKQGISGGIKMLFPENIAARSQDLPIALHDVGQFYWGKPNCWIEMISDLDDKSAVVFIPRWRVQDIDTEEDWQQAEIIASAIFSKTNKLNEL